MTRTIAVAALVLLTAWAFWPAGPTSLPSGERTDAAGVHNPVMAGEPLPDGFRQLLPRDAIAPVYEPVFLAANETPWSADTQIIGVTAGGEAKAYPVSYLNGREMVIDSVAGIPILVTW